MQKEQIQRKFARSSLLVWAFGLTLLLLILNAGGEPWREALRFDRAAIGAGQWWRLLSAHLVHLGWGHTLMNIAGLWVILLVTEPRLNGWEFLGLLGLSALVVSAGLWWMDPGLHWYVGLSGVLHGLLAFGVLDLLHRHDRVAPWLLALLLLKIAWEQFYGPTPGSAELAGGPVVVDAHFYGMVGGILAALVLYGYRRIRTPASI